MNFFRTTDDRRRAREIFLQQIGAHTGSTDDPHFVEAAERFEDTEETLSAVRDALIEYRRAIMMLGKASFARPPFRPPLPLSGSGRSGHIYAQHRDPYMEGFPIWHIFTLERHIA